MTMLLSEEALRPVGVRPVEVSSLPPRDSLRALVLPDLHLPAGPMQKRLLLDHRAFLDQQDWVVLLGDMTACYGTPGEYEAVRGFIDELSRPYSVVNGNHEFFFSPPEDGSSQYGHRFEPGSAQEQRRLMRRFEQFYGLGSRFQAGVYNDVGICLLGLDRIGEDDQGMLLPEHEAWFSETLHRLDDRPLLVFSHFPYCDERLQNVRYYKEGRKPYLLPSPTIRRQMRARTEPTFWFSGHVHFRPSHPLSNPYLTEDGVWQLHCPDGRGYGRADTDHWQPQQYDGMFVRSFELLADWLIVSTTDLHSREVVSTHQFSLIGR